LTRGIPQSRRHQDVNASGVGWRVADAINRAVHRWQHQLNNAAARDCLDEGRVDIQLALIVIASAHCQGLSPADFDTPNGQPALRALAEALASDRELRGIAKREVINASYGGKSTLLIGEWAEVQRASQYLLEKQPRRYEVEYK